MVDIRLILVCAFLCLAAGCAVSDLERQMKPVTDHVQPVSHDNLKGAGIPIPF